MIISDYCSTHGSNKIEDLGVTNFDYKGSRFIDGIIGRIYSGEISNSYSKGTCLSANSPTDWIYIGGLVGYNQGTVSFCYSKASITAAHDVIGGLVGVNV